ncbi:VOC family protein [Priestia megaterium]|uniref:VOC family protein n=1 Tax=Priestia megaterium TaxID=1404 RepID=UPI0026E1AD43|nr:VOC family protein [Priestia megaterium]MDO6851815.1 VOC family protein [Priestia megaterium]
MKINHLNLTVTDVPATQKFLETYFGLTCKSSKGKGFSVMLDNDGFVLTLMKGNEVHYPKSFHIGFSQKNEEEVNKINQRLKEGGFNVEPPKQLHRYTFYVESPGGFLIEVFY